MTDKPLENMTDHRKPKQLYSPSMLKMRSPSVPAMVERAASSDTLKKNFSVGELAIDLISLIKFSVSMLFLM